MPLYVTKICAFGPYLQIFGQSNFMEMRNIQTNIEKHLMNPHNAHNIPQIGQLNSGKFCLAKLNERFVRAKICEIIPNGADFSVSVSYIDFATQGTVPLRDVRISSILSDIESYPIQAISYILCGIMFDWQNSHIETISNAIVGQNVEVYLLFETAGMAFGNVTWRGKNLADYIMNYHQLGLPCPAENMKGDVNKVFFNTQQQEYTNTNPFIYQNRSIRAISKSIPPIRQLNTNWRLNNKPMDLNPGSIFDVIRGIENHNKPGFASFQNIRRLNFDTLSQSAKPAVATFKSTTLLVGNTYKIVCANVENGPCTFSVQLKSTEEELRAMMNEIEDIRHLRNISEKPSLGMACLARYSLDNQIYRAIIMNLKINECQVSYIDYGNIEFVSYSNIYEIPPEFLDKKCFSMRFALSGYKDLGPINDDLKDYFKKLVEYNTLYLKVMPLEGPPLVQYCELYTEDRENIFDLLTNYSTRKLQYPSTQTLNNDDMVTVCYIESAKLFCVQAVKMTVQFEKMMDDLFIYCKTNKCPLRNFDKGRPCTVKYENAWYRAEIIDKIDSRINIRHVDYGIERIVDSSYLNDIPDKYLSLPPQGIPCCLKGFEDSEEGFTEKTITQFEMLAETSEGDRREFKVQIYQIFRNNVYLLNLFDETMKPELNLMKRLFKLNMPFNKYIATEKNNFNISKDFVPDTQTQQINISSSTTIQNENQISANWEKGSTGSQDSKKSNYKNSNNRNHQQTEGYQYREMNGRKRGGGGGGYNRNIPPRFQKQQENRNFNDKNNNFNSDSSGRFSQTQSSRNSFQQIANNSSNDDWSMESEEPTEQYLSFDEKIPQVDLEIPSTDEVLICWWSSPLQFYTHSERRTQSFEKMMKNMQIFYKTKSPAIGPIPIGSHVIARYKQDNVLYRAKILAHNEQLQKYRVEFIDFGNISPVSTSEVYMIEKRFSIEPIMAKLCSFENIILNFDHQYIIGKMEKYLQPGCTVTCNYLSRENLVHYVEIELNMKSFKDLLIQDKLISAISSDMKLELLKNQKIKAKLKEITTLLNFKIEIEGCDANFLCSYYDIKFAKLNSNLLASFKTNYEEKHCIIEVMNVTSDKILLVQPIIPLFTSVPAATICYYPVVCNGFKVKLSYQESENKLHVHKIETENALQQLLNDMFEYYEKNGEEFNNFVIGSVCACLSSDDGNWYRAQIKSMTQGPNNNDCNSIEVYYFDYGNTEKIELNSNEIKFKRLEIEFQQLSALSMEIYLPLKSINNAVIKEIENLTLNVELQIDIIEYFNNNWICDLKYNDYSLLQQLKDMSLIEVDVDFVKELITNNCIKKIDLRVLESKEAVMPKDVASLIEPIKITQVLKVPEQQGEEPMGIPSEQQREEPTDFSSEQQHLLTAYISHFNSPNSFYLQLESKIDELEEMQGNLQIVSTQLPSLVANYTGAICIAKYTVDNTWYRAEIVDNECLAVKYIDYGNTDIIIDGANDIKEIIEPFNKIEPFSIECSLALQPKLGHEWTLDESISSIFNLDESVQFEFLSKGDKKNFINLHKNGENMSEKIFDMNLAKKLQILKNGEKCFISHINNINDFYLQIDSDSAYLEVISTFLSNSYNEYPVICEDFENKYCAALFTEDEQWYRAKILNRTETGFNVFFIDFGNTADSPECRELPINITKYPPLAKSCALRLPQDLEQWSTEAENAFVELSATGETIFTLELKEPKFEKSEIDLFIESKNILEILAPLCPKKIIDFMNVSTYSDIISNVENAAKQSATNNCSITSGDSFSEFYVQLNSSREDLDAITDFLSSTELCSFENDPEIGILCAALFSDDNTFYRAKILKKDDSTYSVYFIDYGNTAETSELRQLPEQYAKLPPIAKKCTLSNPENINFNSQFAVNYFNELEEVDLKIIGENDPLCVELFDQAASIYDKLLQPVPEVRNTVMISHIVSAKEFYVQFETEAPLVAKITEELLNIEKLVPVSSTPEVGEIYAALFADDKAYYRAKLIGIDGSEFEVFFIDFGNSSKCNDLKILPTVLKPYLSMAHKCSLDYDLNLNETIDSRFMNLVNNVHFGETFQMELIKKTDDCSLVKLFSSKYSKNILEELKEELNVDIERKLCRISHCNNPTDFYIQLCEDSIPLEQLTAKLCNAEKEFKKIENPEINQIYAAKFPDDGAYYRAIVLSINNNNYEVIYIDFGNKAVTNDILELPEDLKILPNYAKQCQLYNTSDQINLTKKDEIEHFCSLVSSRVIETFQIQIIKNEKPLSVNLYYDNTNIIDEISKALNDLTLKNFDEDTTCTYLEKTLTNRNIAVSPTPSEQNLLKDILKELMESSVDVNELINDIINNASATVSHEILQEIISKSLNQTEEDGASSLNLTAQAAEELYKNFQEIAAKIKK